MMFRGRKSLQSNSYTHSGASGGNFAYKILVVSMIWNWIAEVEGKNADH